MYKIETYVPSSHIRQVRDALFNAGAGKIGAYDRCCWQTSGTGSFRPLGGSDPFIGTEGKDESCDEIKLELVCSDEALDAALEALLKAHPYETPAYQFWKVNRK